MIVYCDSFDHYTSAYLKAKGWYYPQGGVTIETAAGRGGGGCMRLDSLDTSPDDEVAALQFFTSITTGFIGFACYIDAYPPTNNSLFLGFRDTTYSQGWWTQCHVELRPDGKLEFHRGSTVLGTTADPVPLGQYFFLEVKVTIDDASGEAVIRINEATVIDLSGIDTRQTDVAAFDHVAFWCNQDTGWFYRVDDLYVCDDQNATYGILSLDINNDFLGEIEVEAIYPDADSHEHNNFSPSTPGADHYTLMDETHIDESDYTFSSVDSDLDYLRTLEQVTFPEPEGDRLLCIQPVATVERVGVQALEASLAVHDIGTEGWLSGTITNAWPGAVPKSIGTDPQMLYYPLNFNPTTGDFWGPQWLSYFEFGVKRET